MNEADFNLVVNITVGIEILLYAVCMAAFFYPFMTERKEQGKSKFKKILMVFLVYAVMYFVNMVTSAYGWLCMLIVLILLVAASRFLDMDSEFTFFLGTEFFCIRNLSMLLMRSESYFLDIHLEKNAKSVESVLRNAALGYIFIAVLQMLLFFLMLYIVGRLLKKKTMKLHMKDGFQDDRLSGYRSIAGRMSWLCRTGRRQQFQYFRKRKNMVGETP